MNVIMFHSVGLRNHTWPSPQIGEDVAPFVRKVEALAKSGYESVFFTDARLAEGGHEKLISLTFDDGYLDNWVHVFPVLREYGFKASIFVTTDFVDPRDVVRDLAPFEGFDDATHDPAECCAGFLSWPEMRAMEESGLVEILSHAVTHTWFPCGPEVVDFWRPGSATRPDGPVWMLWNRYRDEKPYYLTRAAEMESRIPYGTPIYQHAKSMVARRYEPHEPQLEARLIEHVAASGGSAFFERSHWRSQLESVVEKTRSEVPPQGHLESEESFLERVRYELARSREILGERLGHEVTGFAWPGGGASDAAARIATDVGYRTFTRPSVLATTAERLPQAKFIPRIGSVCRENWRDRDLGTLSGHEFLWYLERMRGESRGMWKYRAAKSWRILRSMVKEYSP